VKAPVRSASPAEPAANRTRLILRRSRARRTSDAGGRPGLLSPFARSDHAGWRSRCGHGAGAAGRLAAEQAPEESESSATERREQDRPGRDHRAGAHAPQTGICLTATWPPGMLTGRARRPPHPRGSGKVSSLTFDSELHRQEWHPSDAKIAGLDGREARQHRRDTAGPYDKYRRGA